MPLYSQLERLFDKLLDGNDYIAVDRGDGWHNLQRADAPQEEIPCQPSAVIATANGQSPRSITSARPGQRPLKESLKAGNVSVATKSAQLLGSARPVESSSWSTVPDLLLLLGLQEHTVRLCLSLYHYRRPQANFIGCVRGGGFHRDQDVPGPASKGCVALCHFLPHILMGWHPTLW